ncbi:MAG: polyprenyl synthetase family protein, partial [Anaerolineae bacterium]|nr:polyprenyl synthetase family protein [Anaerolineae bacterium]
TESAAVLGGAPVDEIETLRDYGYKVGMAFQIMDDILDFVGDSSTVGKPVGNDLRQGTVTLPVFHFLQDNPEALAVMEATGNGHAGADPLGELIADIRRSPAIEATRREAVEFVAEAKALLARWPDTIYRQALAQVADYVVARTF